MTSDPERALSKHAISSITFQNWLLLRHHITPWTSTTFAKRQICTKQDIFKMAWRLKTHGNPPFLYQILKRHDLEITFVEDFLRIPFHDVIIFLFRLSFLKMRNYSNFKSLFLDKMSSEARFVAKLVKWILHVYWHKLWLITLTLTRWRARRRV